MICDVISHYKLTISEQIVMNSWNLVSHQSHCFVLSVMPRNQSLITNIYSRLEVDQQLVSWREVLEGNGLRISRKKAKYLRPA